MYKMLRHGGVQRLADNACIPENQQLKDWRDYLDWLAAGNTPQAADAPPLPDMSRAELAAACDAILADLTLPLRLRTLAEKLKKVM